MSAAEPPRCPNCQKTLQPKDILCVNCGYNLLTHTQVQFQKDAQQHIPGGKSINSKRKSHDKIRREDKEEVRKEIPGGKSHKSGRGDWSFCGMHSQYMGRIGPVSAFHREIGISTRHLRVWTTFFTKIASTQKNWPKNFLTSLHTCNNCLKGSPNTPKLKKNIF